MIRLGLLAVAAAGIIPVSAGPSFSRNGRRDWRLWLVLSAISVIGFPALAADLSGPVLTPRQSSDFVAAIKQARATLPFFWRRFASQPSGPDDYDLKVDFTRPDGGVEGLWIADLHRQGDSISGRIADEPATLPNLHRLQWVKIDPARIVDWTYRDHGRQYGHFTTRVMAKSHPEVQEQLRKFLSDSPLPAEATHPR